MFHIYGSIIKKDDKFFFYFPDIPLEVELGTSFTNYESISIDALRTFLQTETNRLQPIALSPIAGLIKKTKAYLINQGYSVDNFIDYKQITVSI